ncbi:ribokinase [Bacillus marinisedimentorum]|uniref:ribokinase n=1 Tax=Bacillus marinisedimentorum TaxID=1821260 RepID=UPI0007DF5DB0|nr:ribokinase [Bacillus marinisedimentorum]
MNPKITVIGSINMDVVTSTDRFPDQGETVPGTDFATVPGGKGANQAVAAARLGADVHMIGRVGDDVFGQNLREHLLNEGIHVDGVQTAEGCSTGIATILLTEGDNRIVVVPGANHELTADDAAQYEDMMADSDLVMLQLEIPLDTVISIAAAAKKLGTPVLLNPAPIQPLPERLLRDVTYITPNEHELGVLLGSAGEEYRDGLLKKLIVTKGAEGVVYFVGSREAAVPGYQVEAMDTTGAGDTFNGAFAVAVSKGMSVAAACRFGNAAAALSVKKLGAQGGMPVTEEVRAFLNEK